MIQEEQLHFPWLLKQLIELQNFESLRLTSDRTKTFKDTYVNILIKSSGRNESKTFDKFKIEYNGTFLDQKIDGTYENGNMAAGDNISCLNISN